MAEFSKMAIWEVNGRLRLLEEFWDLLWQYYGSQDLEVRQRINRIHPRARETMWLAESPARFHYIEPPALGGRSYEIDPVANLFELEQLQISPIRLIDQVEQTIAKYKDSARKAWMRTLNPFFWLNELIIWLFGLPFRFLLSVGVFEDSAGNPASAFMRVKKIVTAFFAAVTWLVATVWGFVQIADALGYVHHLNARSSAD